MTALLEPPEGWGYEDKEQVQDEPYTDREWKDELLLDDGIDRWREDEMDWDSPSEE